jgi:parallel beta-helix repeat protein
MRRFCVMALVFLASAFSFATSSVSGNLNDLTGTAVSSRTFVRFNLRGCGGNQARVTGTANIVPAYYDLTPTAGLISGTLYRNDTEISCGGSVGVTWYGVVIYRDGKPGPEVAYTLSSSSFNLNSATPNTSSPVVASPTGDGTYARLDGGNTPFTGAVQGPAFRATGDPWFNVKAYGALGDAVTADSTNIQLAITAASNNSTVYFPPGIYSIDAILSVSGKTNLRVLLDKGAILKAAAGLGANPLLQITGASSDIVLSGGQFDGNSVASNCIKIVNSGAVSLKRIDVSGTVCHGTVNDGISATHDGTNYYYVQDVFIHNNYVYSTTQHGISARAVKDFNVTDNRVETPGAGIYACIRVQAVGAVIKGNYLTGFGTANAHSNAIQLFATSQYDISNNVIVGATGAGDVSIPIYVDTGLNGAITSNTVYGGGKGIRLEVSKGTTISTNTVSDNVSYGIYANGRSDAAQKNALESTTGLTASSNVTLTADAIDFQEGSDSVQAVIAGAFTTGNIFYQDFGSVQDWGTYPIIRLYVKSDTTLARGVLQLKLAGDTGLTTVHTTIDLPPLTAATWYQIELFDQEFYPKFGSVRSWGIYAASDPGAVTLHFDDLRIDVPNGPVTVTGNNVSKTQDNSIFIESLKNVVVSSNLVEDSGATGIMLQADGAGTALQRVVVANNSVRNTQNLGTNSFGIKLRQATSGTVDEVRVLGNELSSNFNSGNAINTFGTITNFLIAGNTVSASKDGAFTIGTTANLYNDASNVLALKNSTTAQAFRVYNTDDGAGNNEYLQMDWSSNTGRIFTGKAGTGSNRVFKFGANTSTQWQVNTSGNLGGTSDNTNDIGSTGANRPRSIYAGTSVIVESAANGAQWISGSATELLTLSTSGTTTDTTANLLPANSIIESVTTDVTTTITTAVSFSVGDPTTAARFSASAGGMTATSTRVGIDHWSGAVSTLATGPSQAAAAKVRITTNANPGAGVVRITVFYRQFVAPTS